MRRFTLNKYQILSIWGVIFLCLVVLFTYRLGDAVLASYDEAWYAEIARNILITRNPLKLQFNGQVFTDHPPFGYILMFIPIFFLGSNEFSSRLVSATLGAGTVMLMYAIGKKISNRAVGVMAAVILISSLWFMFRARSGNLDVPFLFFETLTIFVSLHKSKNFLYYLSASFAALFLTKTLVGLGLLPVILFVLWTRRKEISRKKLLLTVVLWLVIVLPWYIYNQRLDSEFIFHHFVQIGLRGGANSYTFQVLTAKMMYLAIGIGKWYKIFLVSTILAIPLFIIHKTSRVYWTVLFLWFLGFSVFLFSSKTEIWHLLPLFPPIALIIPNSLISSVRSLFPHKRIFQAPVLLGCVMLGMYQFRQFSNLIYISGPAVSNEKDISIKAGKYEQIYLMGTFYPAAVYYSGKTITPLRWDPNAYQKMIEILRIPSSGVFIIDAELKKQLEDDAVPFQLLDQNSSYYLIAPTKNN